MTEDHNHMTWMSDKINREIELRDSIVRDQKIDELFELPDNSDFSIALSEILSNKCGYNPDKLNPTQKTLFLCMLLEDAGQADHILSFLQEEYSSWRNEIVDSLRHIGAIKSAEIIQRAIEILPEGDSWFFDHSDDKAEILMRQLDSEFSDYPDGPMRDLYRKYAERHRNNLF